VNKLDFVVVAVSKLTSPRVDQSTNWPVHELTDCKLVCQWIVDRNVFWCCWSRLDDVIVSCRDNRNAVRCIFDARTFAVPSTFNRDASICSVISRLVSVLVDGSFRSRYTLFSLPKYVNVKSEIWHHEGDYGRNLCFVHLICWLHFNFQFCCCKVVFFCLDIVDNGGGWESADKPAGGRVHWSCHVAWRVRRDEARFVSPDFGTNSAPSFFSVGLMMMIVITLHCTRQCNTVWESLLWCITTFERALVCVVHHKAAFQIFIHTCGLRIGSPVCLQCVKDILVWLTETPAPSDFCF